MGRAKLALVLAVFVACETPLSWDEVRALGAAQARWAARGFDDYRFEILTLCFCPEEITRWLRVDVAGGQVVQIVMIDSTGTNGTVPSQYWTILPTVEELFEWIGSANEGDGLEDVSVEFDAQLGFPSRVTFDASDNYLDAGSTHQLRNVSPLPANPP